MLIIEDQDQMRSAPASCDQRRSHAVFPAIALRDTSARTAGNFARVNKDRGTAQPPPAVKAAPDLLTQNRQADNSH